MPASQLKRLKASLRESGVTGPQKSKKQKQRDSKDGTARANAATRASKLDSIRETFKPFEVKTSSRGPKREYATTGKAKDAVLGRPGVTKGLGEELRQKRLLVEMKQRNRVGGIMDRRFGENDPTMTPEERAHERFVREKQRGGKKSGLFDLEADDALDEGVGLTHLGNPLSLTAVEPRDDYQYSDDDNSLDDVEDEASRRASKRQRLLDGIAQLDENDTENANGRPKTKQEIMKEVVAKSKLHKYERQKAKEEDDDLRQELDADLKDIFALMSGRNTSSEKAKNSIDPGRAALMEGKSREEADKEYDQQLRMMTQEARSRPTTRTKTEEEIAEEEAERLKDLEKKRLRRMRGEAENTDSEDEADLNGDANNDDVHGEVEDDEFGLGLGIMRTMPPKLDVEDEDDFDLDADLIASGSELDVSFADDDSELDSDASDGDSASGEDNPMMFDDDEDFVKDLITAEDAGRVDLAAQNKATKSATSRSDLAFTFPCPSTHAEFLEISKGDTSLNLITIIQRIRALYSVKLDGKNRVKLATFGQVLVDHLHHIANQSPPVPFQVLDQLIRHVHSLAKTYPIEVAGAFRQHLIAIGNDRPLTLNAGDLILFTAIGTIFPTSDHFHQAVTPAMTCMAWYLGQSNPNTLGDLATGAYVCTQFLGYQKLSKRYIPEVVSYTLIALEALSAVPPKTAFGDAPKRTLSPDFRLVGSSPATSRSITFWDTAFSGPAKSAEAAVLKQALISTFVSLVSHMSELWRTKSAYIEIMTPLSQALAHLLSGPCVRHLAADVAGSVRTGQTKLARLLAQARIERRPLALHEHRPLPIKTSIPKFEERFNPERKSGHYDPDQERAEASKLRAAYKKERKGALRELRKDANFVARDSLRRKKQADAEYNQKYRRLVAEIQGAEGREANAYDREKRLRQGKK